jgi:hypothetical protein
MKHIVLVARTIGMGRYGELRRLAVDGKAGKVFWADEVERLKARCIELGIDTRRRIPGGTD